MISGTKVREEREYEKKHRLVSRLGAQEGIVLLKNQEGLLPLSRSEKIAVYGSGALFTIKGGNGSGDVNSRETVSIWDGLVNAGYQIANQAWGDVCIAEYQKARIDWRDTIWAKVDAAGSTKLNVMWEAYVSTPFVAPVGPMPEKKEADVALYVLSRTSGEGCDRRAKPGDYYLLEEEKAFIGRLAELYENIVLILNTCGVIDMEVIENCPNIKSILYAGLPGMEAGNAVADVVSGKVTPSGKLTDTWALRYEDYPSSASFSYIDGNVDEEVYEEGIYVGYRYFDTFQVPVRYGFGFGLSYTSFSIQVNKLDIVNLKTQDPCITISVQVENTGTRKGKEVVQIYAACPQSKLMKEYRRLIGFSKTEELQPGEVQELSIQIPLRSLTSYSESLPGWIMEEGVYGIYVGNSLESSELIGSVKSETELVFERTQNVCIPQKAISEISPDRLMVDSRVRDMLRKAASLPHVAIGKDAVETVVVSYGTEDGISEKARGFVEKLSVQQLIELSAGDVETAQGSQLGSAGSRVPGSAAQTSRAALEQGLKDIVLADGPAGLRLAREYYLVDGVPVKLPIEKSLENGFLYKGDDTPKGEVYYQYCTAFPTGTVLAQTWNPAILEACGHAMAEELREFHVEILLAPGMNIHRNPLCGRNFEYFSEDPVVSGLMAAAITRGIQSIERCGATIKHLACNNQEDNRTHCDSVLSERTLREIYLRGFEIAVKTADPVSIMTSYNPVNGINSANNYDLCTKIARDEWKYRGMIMTDWTTTNNDDRCTASGCMRAGNDIVMPGAPMDHENIKNELSVGTLDIADLKRSAARVVETVWRLTQ